LDVLRDATRAMGSATTAQSTHHSRPSRTSFSLVTASVAVASFFTGSFFFPKR
jgi:hypothetical protein